MFAYLKNLLSHLSEQQAPSRKQTKSKQRNKNSEVETVNRYRNRAIIISNDNKQ